MKLLDCTLRDGGYVNNWEFTENSFYQIANGLQEAGVDVIELGLIGSGPADGGFRTKFPDLEQLPKISRIKNCKSIFTVMLTYSEVKHMQIPNRREGDVEGIRIAYFKSEYQQAIQLAKEIREKGYLVFLQAMATSLYQPDELKDMLERINDLHPYAFYMVDSFGVMYPSDVISMFEMIHPLLLSDIQLGFHAHNNMQMALANAIAFIEKGLLLRDICVDASIYGMGRGAGNVNMELLMEYMNKKQNTAYHPSQILHLYQDVLSSDYQTYYWGYSPEYFLTAKENINGVYIWYLRNKGITRLRDIERILSMLPEEAKYTLKKAIADQIIATVVKSNDG